MQAFAELIERLDASRSTKLKVAALVDFFAQCDPRDGAWSLQILLGGRRRRLITGRRLRQICLESSPIPEWLFDDCYSHVGDSAETIALLWQQCEPDDASQGVDSDQAHSEHASWKQQPLHDWMETLLPDAAALSDVEQAKAVRALWRGLSSHELLVANKLLTGGLRIGVARGLVVKALAQCSDLDEAELQHRLMGGFTPTPEAWLTLLAPTDQNGDVPSRPYPFFLASPLEIDPNKPGSPPLAGDAASWLIEWKWDGIRGQLIRRQGDSFLWSRGEELLNEAFPELITAAAALADGTVIDGEIMIWPAGEAQPSGFAQLQRRLGRKKPSRPLQAECPAAFVAYDLLELQGEDWRARSLHQRREALESLMRDRLVNNANDDALQTWRLRLSPRLTLANWHELEPLRQEARAVGAEGLMLKALDSPYQNGRKRGSWWKHKLDPYRLDVVLLYAQAGSGRRANLFTDYTFGLWDTNGQLVSVAKAYSGLDDREITALDRWIRSHTIERFGPVRAVEPVQVFEIAFEGIQQSRRHKSGLAVRFPRISRWRQDKQAREADTLANALALLDER